MKCNYANVFCIHSLVCVSNIEFVHVYSDREYGPLRFPALEEHTDSHPFARPEGSLVSKT